MPGRVFFSASKGLEVNSSMRLPAPLSMPCCSISLLNPVQSKPRLCSAARVSNSSGGKPWVVYISAASAPVTVSRSADCMVLNNRSMRSRPASIVEKKLLSSFSITCPTRVVVSDSSG